MIFDKIDETEHQRIHLKGGANHTVVGIGTKLYTCGLNDKGQLGLGNYENQTRLKQIDLNIPISRIVDIGCGWDFSLVLVEKDQRKRLIGFGNNKHRVLDTGFDLKSTINKPMIVNVDSELIRIESSVNTWVGIDMDGRVMIYGETKQYVPSERLKGRWIDLDVEERVVDVKIGFRHIGVIFESGRIGMIGQNKYGQTGAVVFEIWQKIERMVGTCRARKLSSGWSHLVCEVETDTHTLMIGWGRNDFGQVVGSADCQTDPVMIYGEPVEILVSGSEHNLAVSKSQLFSWGWNEHGNCGSFPSISKPFGMMMRNVFYLGTGYSHSMALIGSTQSHDEPISNHLRH